MSLRRVASFNRHKAPPLTCVLRPEMIQLRKLPHLVNAGVNLTHLAAGSSE
jgi:hypothetical protein